MDFEAYLASKRIDSQLFSSAEPELWQSWKRDFEQMHPGSFTMQKLNLINPIRRKYTLAVEVVKASAPPKPIAPAVKAGTSASSDAAPVVKAAPRIPRPGVAKLSPKSPTPETAVSPSAEDTVLPPVETNVPSSPTPTLSPPQDPAPAPKPAPAAKPVIPRPVIKPKPKPN